MTSIAREYLRVSIDKSGHERSNEEQHEDHVVLADERNWILGQPYQDVVSASRYSNAKREGFADLMADLKNDTFGANILLLWESSRGSRKVSEWVALIELCEERSVLIHVWTHERTYDPSNSNDIRSLINDANDSQYESAKTSKRVTRSAGKNAQKGRPHGRTPYGYRRIHDVNTGKLIGQKVHPDEAEVVREMYGRIIAGHALHAIAGDFKSRGIRKKSGAPFEGRDLSQMAEKLLYIGMRRHKPKRGGPVTTTKAEWPALVSEEVFLATQRILTAPERKTTKPGRGVHLLSMIAQCDVCSSRLAVRFKDKRQAYYCHAAGHTTVAQEKLDSHATELIKRYLSNDSVHAEIRAKPTDEQALSAVRADIEKARADLADLAKQVGSGALSATLAAAAEPRILRRLERGWQQAKELSTPDVLRGHTGPREQVDASWENSPMSTRREIVRFIFSPEIMGELKIINNPTPGTPAPIDQRVVFVQVRDGKAVRVPKGR